MLANVAEPVLLHLLCILFHFLLSDQSTDSELRLDWFEEDPVQVIKKFNLPQYKLSDNFTYSICTDENAIFDGK